MAQYKLQNPALPPAKRTNLLLPVAFLWGLAVIFIIGYLVIDAMLNNSGTKFYLLPWTFLTGAVVLAPGIYLLIKKRFDPFHPLVFAAWTYFFPAFVLGGFILAGGFSNQFFLNFIQNEEVDLPMTFVYVILGYAGMTLGFFLPIGRKIGKRLVTKLPVLNWKPEHVMKGGLVLMAIGLANTVAAFALGILGFQRVTEAGMFDGVIFMLTWWWLAATFILWLAVFRTPKMDLNAYIVVTVLLVVSFGKSAFQGNRGSLLQMFIALTFAFVYSGKKILLKHKVWGGVLLFGALFLGMIYGTTFRTLKGGTEERISMDKYTSNIFDTFDQIADQDIGANMGNAFMSLVERLDSVSQLAVVVSNYETLAAYEADYGLDNNIWKDSIAFLIPRFLWYDKPVATDPYKYGDLYFNYGENAFTLTPMGDLLRNFGPWGVPLGMILIGIFLRFIYSTLIEDQDFSFWRSTLYYMLLVSTSYEASFGLLIPYDIKIAFITVLGLHVVWAIVNRLQLLEQPKMKV